MLLAAVPSSTPWKSLPEGPVPACESRMPIRVSCPGCGANYRAPDHLVGKTTPCQKCGATVPIRPPAAESLEPSLVPLPDEPPRRAAPASARPRPKPQHVSQEAIEETAEAGAATFPYLYLVLGEMGASAVAQIVLFFIYPPVQAVRMGVAFLALAALLGFAAGVLWAVGVMFSIDPGKAVLMLLIWPLGLVLVPNLSEKQRSKFDGPAECMKWSLVVLLIAAGLGMVVGFMTMDPI